MWYSPTDVNFLIYAEKENQGDKDFNRDAVSHRLKEDVVSNEMIVISDYK